MKYYTGKGDNGNTDTAEGRVRKDSPIIEFIGTLDELNAFLGYSIEMIRYDDIKDVLRKIETKIYYISAISSGYAGLVKKKDISIGKADVDELESITDSMSKETKPLIKFLRPNGSGSACLVNICRAITRRAERQCAKCEIRNPYILAYLNRLSSLLFTIFRVINKRDKFKEETF